MRAFKSLYLKYLDLKIEAFIYKEAIPFINFLIRRNTFLFRCTVVAFNVNSLPAIDSSSLL